MAALNSISLVMLQDEFTYHNYHRRAYRALMMSVRIRVALPASGLFHCSTPEPPALCNRPFFKRGKKKNAKARMSISVMLRQDLPHFGRKGDFEALLAS